MRRGLTQNPNYSLFLAIISQNKYLRNIEQFLNDYVKFLTPDIFLSLNQGEIFKLFNTNINYQYNSSDMKSFYIGAKHIKIF